MFTSRSFSSRALRPHDSKYWTAYKTGLEGRRQAVLLDMSRESAEDLDFPVLFPVLDALNHSNEAKVDWTFAPGRFSIATNDHVEAGGEVFNNYGPKSNDELFLGYGFCIADNPHDTVSLSLKPPPEDLQEELKRLQPGYFTSEGSWSTRNTIFRLRRPSLNFSDPSEIFYELPEPLLELLLYILRHERGLDFSLVEASVRYLASHGTSSGSRYLPHIARMLVQFCSPKLGVLQSANLSSEPRNAKQKQASIYRHGQLNILQSLIAALKAYAQSLIVPPEPIEYKPNGPALMTLESALANLLSEDQRETFLVGIEASANTQDIEQLRLAGWEEDIWALLLCFIFLASRESKIVLPEYVDLTTHVDNSDTSPEPERTILRPPLEAQDLEQANELLQLVRTTASACPSSLWDDLRWNSKFIAGVGGKIVRWESFMMAVEEEARLHVLFVFE